MVVRLIDFCLTCSEKYFRYTRIQSGREQAQKYIKTMREGMGYRGNDFLLPLKKYGELGRDEKFSLF
jgi:hypothetical protein